MNKTVRRAATPRMTHFCLLELGSLMIVLRGLQIRRGKYKSGRERVV
jgi:hypothetical protein